MTVTVTFTVTAKNAVNRSHSKLRLVEHVVQFVANFFLVVFFRPVELLRDVDVQASGRYGLFFLPRHHYPTEFSQDVGPDID